MAPIKTEANCANRSVAVNIYEGAMKLLLSAYSLRSWWLTLLQRMKLVKNKPTNSVEQSA
jgi:hypothetical protein